MELGLQVALYFKKFESHILKFQKILKQILDVDNVLF